MFLTKNIYEVLIDEELDSFIIVVDAHFGGVPGWKKAENCKFPV